MSANKKTPKINTKIENDSRFNKISSDPKFKEIPKKVRKVEITDPRFAKMFTDKRFHDDLQYDEYGRKLKNKDKSKNELKKFYTHEQEDDVDQDEVEEEEESYSKEEVLDEKENEKVSSDQEKEIGSHPEEDSEVNNELDQEYESDTSEEFVDFLEEHYKGKMEEDAFDMIEDKEIPTGDETKRLSVMNLDWENITATDLFVLMSSFCEGKSKIKQVEIYPSEFGIKEIERERIEGPDKEIFQKENSKKSNSKNKIIHSMDQADDEDNEDGFNSLNLRKYELKKLKFYYAIVHCDTKETALNLYNGCDGMEIERTQSFMDLRFVPDSLTEMPYPPRDTCTQMPTNYDPKFFFNSALQHSKVDLTWDKNNPKRNELISKAFGKEQFKEDEIKQLLMSSDSESDEDAKMFLDSVMNKKKDEKEENNGLKLLNKKREKELNIKEGETIEITFNKGFEGINEKIGSEYTISKKDKSVYADYLDRKKDFRRRHKTQERQKKEEIKNKRKGDDSKKHANKKELNLLVDDSLKNKQFKFDNKDDRFQAIYTDNKYAIDPTNKEYKKNKK